MTPTPRQSLMSLLVLAATAIACSSEPAAFDFSVFLEDPLVPAQVPTLTASPNNFNADGQQSSKLTLILKDRYSNPLTGFTVNFNSSVPSDMFSPRSSVMTNCSGTTFVAMTPITGGIRSIQASVGKTKRRVSVNGICPGVFRADRTLSLLNTTNYFYLASADYNHDGFQDIAGQDQSGTFILARGYGNGYVASDGNLLQKSFGGAAQFVAVDLNNDGNQDFVTALPNSNSVAVMIYNGNTLSTVTTYTAGNGVRGLTAGDVNRDGNSDVVVCNANSSTCSLLLGNGDGTLQTARAVATIGRAAVTVLADVNNDGNLDLITATMNSSLQVAQHLGTGTSYFRPGIVFNTNSALGSVTGLTVADLNLDGKLDLIISGNTAQAVYLNNGNGATSFMTHTVLSGGQAASVNYPVVAQVADLNGDNRPDLIYSVRSLVFGWKAAFNNGTGGFNSFVTFAGAWAPIYQTITDLNNDGKPDVIVSDFNQGGYTWLQVNAGSLAHSPNIALLGERPWNAWPVDLNRDGNLDVLTQASGNNKIAVMLGDGHGQLPTVNFISGGAYPVFVVAADFNQDGLTDAAGINNGGNSVTIMTGDGNGALTVTGTVNVGLKPYGAAVGDFDGNGFQDIAVTGYSDNTVTVLFNRGNANFNNPNILTGLGQPYLIATKDVNKDGRSDLVVTNSGTNSISVFLNQTGGNFQPASTFAAGPNPIGLTISDFNADGNQDLAVADHGNSNVTILLGNGSGSFTASSYLSYGFAPYDVQSGDINNDGRVDLLVSNFSANGISVFYGRGDGTFRNVGTYLTAGPQPYGVALGDFDGNGFLDAAIANYANMTIGIHLHAGCAF